MGGSRADADLTHELGEREVPRVERLRGARPGVMEQLVKRPCELLHL